MIPLILSTFNPKLKFCILVGPNYFKGEKMREMIKNKIEVPSLFFSGETVNLKIFEIRMILFQQNSLKN
jgi:hypothetical protein